jgi:hypothetical protein
MLERIVEKLLNRMCCWSLPKPSNQEQGFLVEMREAFRAIPVMDTVDTLPSEMEWVKHMNRLRELVLSRDPREFLRWDVVSSTMFVSSARSIRTELRYLQRCSDWDSRWRAAIKESWVGHPPPCLFYLPSSGNLLHHAYHLAQFEQKTKTPIDRMNYVLEFGGGYGSMCRLFYNLGFCGKYVIFDLSPFSALQRYYLQALGFPVLTPADAVKAKRGIVCVSDFQQLKTMMDGDIQAQNSMFVATWSISETPIKIRDVIMPFMARFNSFLIAYQDKFGEVDNSVFFEHWKNINNHVVWHNWPIEHALGNHYLVA